MFENKITKEFNDIISDIDGVDSSSISDIDDIRCLSVRWPWAGAIIYGARHIISGKWEFKNVENRSWQTKYRGPLLIQVSKTFSKREFDVFSDFKNVYFRGFTDKSYYILGGCIIGIVDLVDVYDKRYKQSLSQWAEVGMNHWILKNSVEFEFPIPHKGKPTLFPITENKEIIRKELEKTI